MDPISVPAPPHSSYNPNRRISDLLYNQLKHFQHIEMKRGDLGIDPAIARDIHTEGGAAKYIAAVTTALRHGPSASPAKVIGFPTPRKPEAGASLSIAAAAATEVGETTVPAKKSSTRKPSAVPIAKAPKRTP